MRQPHSFTRDGFSLIELAIVLVILGLLVGGILAGQSLIRGAELKSISTELQTIRSSVSQFQDQYYALPGDIPHATDIWGRVGGGTGQCANPVTDSDLAAPTCNGNGDGRFFGFSGDSWQETYRAWEHLSAAGLYEGRYTGIAASGCGTPYCTQAEENVPRAPISGTIFAFNWQGVVTDPTSVWFNNQLFGNVIEIGIDDNWANGLFLSPEEMWNIDTKFDDGKPGTGTYNSFAPATGFTGCADSVNAATAEYVLTNTAKSCKIIYRLGL